jgi:amino acid adenylation domain-containing protein
LHHGFLRAAARFPDRPALEIAGSSYTYSELGRRGLSIAATLEKWQPRTEPSVVAIFAHQTVTAYAGVLGALFRGDGYVPLSPRLPAVRTQAMLERARCSAIIADSRSDEELAPLLDCAQQPLLLLLADRSDTRNLAERWPIHTFVGFDDFEEAESYGAQDPPDESMAYLLFTSGSTGNPKGVMVAHRNVVAFVDAMVERYSITEEDRVAQTSDLTFDLSVLPIYLAWERGACLCCATGNDLIHPRKFIQSSDLTFWVSVPSTAMFMQRLGALKEGQYPSLRWSVFCGEPLLAATAAAWCEATPNGCVENLYGPTELTVACTLYRWDPTRSPAECEFGVVPIGYPYPGMTALVVDENLNEVEPGDVGELLMTGSQLTLGYWQDQRQTAAAFVTPAGQDFVFYRTGDLVRKPRSNDSPLTFIGRRDHQVKILGERIELGEVESVIRAVTGKDAVVLGWPLSETGAAGLVAFVGSVDLDASAVRSEVAARLPAHMVPRQIHLLPKLPLNANGKFDRKALLESLQADE